MENEREKETPQQPTQQHFHSLQWLIASWLVSPRGKK